MHLAEPIVRKDLLDVIKRVDKELSGQTNEIAEEEGEEENGDDKEVEDANANAIERVQEDEDLPQAATPDTAATKLDPEIEKAALLLRGFH